MKRTYCDRCDDEIMGVRSASYVYILFNPPYEPEVGAPIDKKEFDLCKDCTRQLVAVLIGGKDVQE